MTAASILAQKPSEYGIITIRSDAPVREAVDLLAEHNIGALIVSDDDNPVAGIISERDIVRSLRGASISFLDEPIAKIMTTNVHTCAPTETTGNILSRMTSLRVRHLPVMDGNHLAGMISIGDVVKIRLHDLVEEADAMRDYIAHA